MQISTQRIRWPKPKNFLPAQHRQVSAGARTPPCRWAGPVASGGDWRLVAPVAEPAKSQTRRQVFCAIRPTDHSTLSHWPPIKHTNSIYIKILLASPSSPLPSLPFSFEKKWADENNATIYKKKKLFFFFKLSPDCIASNWAHTEFNPIPLFVFFCVNFSKNYFIKHSRTSQNFKKKKTN